MPLSLHNKKIIISAGASGIGWATTKVCLSKGAIVYLCDIDIKSLRKVQKHPLNNKKLFSYECDASDEYEVSDLFDKIKKKTNKIDALINNVGIAGPTGSLEKLSSDEWEKTLKINVISHFYFTKLAIPMLKKKQKWINYKYLFRCWYYGFSFTVSICCQQVGYNRSYQDTSNGVRKI